MFLAQTSVILGTVVGVVAHTVVISNVEPRRDTTGQILTAHDGNVIQWTSGGDFHFYGMSYGLCTAQGCGHGECGFQETHNVSLFTSPDLSQGSWKFQGDILPVDARPAGIYYRPKVVFNKQSGLYVLWVNWLSNRRNFGSSAYLVATSQTPLGPFKVVHEKVETKFKTGGDFDIFVDEDEQAYLIYTSIAEGHGISIERLTPDYLTSTLVSTGILTGRGCYEAPALFKRKGVYYALYGTCCCFCSAGDTRHALTSLSPLNFSSSTSYPLGRAGGAQENSVMRIATQSGVEYVWTGDRWNSAPDGEKDHDFQYWVPIEFNDNFDNSTGRFIKSSGPAIYWENQGVLNHVLSCNVCPNLDPCSQFVAVTQAYIDSLEMGDNFSCTQISEGPILPLRQVDHFTLELPDAHAHAHHLV